MITVFMPVLINGVAVTMPVIMPLQVTSSARDLPSECNDVDNNSELCVQPSTQPCSCGASVSKLKAQYEQKKNALLNPLVPSVRLKGHHIYVVWGLMDVYYVRFLQVYCKLGYFVLP
jgi:hypothetical protein